jgi:hypothetical protein
VIVFVGSRAKVRSVAKFVRFLALCIRYGDNINFYHIEYNDGFNGTSMAMISEDRLHEIEFKVTFRDIEIQIARGEKVVA